LALLATLAVALLAIGITAAFGTLSTSPSKFQSGDGDMIVSTADSNAGFHDWANVKGTCSAGTVECHSGNFAHIPDIASSQLDDSFVSGQKQDTECPDLTDHGNPPKDDFVHVASYSETDPLTLHTFLYGATIRYQPNGTASENVELKQGDNGECTPGGLLARTIGDKLLAFDYLNGGAIVDLHVLTWIDGTDPNNNACFVANDPFPCWGSAVKHPSPTSFEGKASPNNITAANNSISGTAQKAGEFAEFGVDLVDAGVIPANSCEAFPQTVWESRSSGSSFVSTTKDISIENQTISNCGEIKIIKQTAPRGVDQKWSFTSGTAQNTSKLPANSGAGGVDCTTGDAGGGVDANGAFCLNDRNNSGKTQGSTADDQNDPDNTIDETGVFAGTYSVTEGTVPAGFEFGSITCTGGTTTKSGQTVTITLGVNDTVVCVYRNNQVQGAIQVNKTAKDAHCHDNSPPTDCDANFKRPLGSAGFQIWRESNSTTGLQRTANGNVAADTLVKAQDTTDASGVVCFDGLSVNDATHPYYVHESSVPSGYFVSSGQQDQQVNFNTGSTCDGTPNTVNVEDVPLSKIEVIFTSLAGAGITRSQIACTDSTNSTVPAVSENGLADATPSRYDDTDEVFGAVGTSRLQPGVYTCTVDVDP
jgi:hypothetical protein